MPAAPSLLEARDNPPCPGANGTVVGFGQQFTLLCGLSTSNNVMSTMSANSLTDCMNLCSSTHPRCGGLTFSGTTCTLESIVDQSKAVAMRNADSAIAIYPGATSNCQQLRGEVTSNGQRFATYCGNSKHSLSPRQLLPRRHQRADSGLLQSSTAKISSKPLPPPSRTALASVPPPLDVARSRLTRRRTRVDLKGPATTGDNILESGIDTAILLSDSMKEGSSGDLSPGASSFQQAPPVTQIIPALQTVTVTPTAASTSRATAVRDASFTVSSVVIASVAPGGSTFLRTEATTIPLDAPTITGASSAFLPSASTSPSEGSSSRAWAWIAAPVGGSVAGVVLIVLLFVLCGRHRRKRQRYGGDVQGRSLWFDWLPLPRRGAGNRRLGSENGSRSMGNNTNVSTASRDRDRSWYVTPGGVGNGGREVPQVKVGGVGSPDGSPDGSRMGNGMGRVEVGSAGARGSVLRKPNGEHGDRGGSASGSGNDSDVDEKLSGERDI